MKEEQTIPGVVTVEPSVLEIIARLTALEVPGVVGIAETRNGSFPWYCRSFRDCGSS